MTTIEAGTDAKAMTAPLPVGELAREIGPTISGVTTVGIETEKNVVTTRSVGRKMARDIGFGVANQTRLASATSEPARTIIRYAESGGRHFEDRSNDEKLKIQALVGDRGPGIPDVDEALGDGFTTTHKSLDAGPPGAKRLVKCMNIDAKPGHTRVTIDITQRRT